MRNSLMALAAAAALLSAGPVLAQEGTAAGVAGGAATGAVLGGPVGAVVGGAAGAVLGTAIDPPPEEVRSYVVQEQRPSVTVTEEVVVGEPLSEEVVLYEVPEHTNYRYTIVNDRRVIVDPQTRQVIEIIE